MPPWGHDFLVFNQYRRTAVLTKTYFRNQIKTICGSVIFGCLTALATPVMAANEAMLDLIDIMEKKGTLTKDEAELLRAAAKADVEKTEAVASEAKEAAKKEVEKVTKDLPKIETAGKLKVSSGDGDFSWGLIGRIHADYNLVNSDINKIGNDAFIRRARLGMEGTMWKHWIWKLEMDFAEDALSTKDAFIGYKDSNWWLKAGQSHIPFGLATISSSKYMLFIERPLLADGPLQPSRQLGVAGFMHDPNGERWTLHTGIFGGAVGSGGSEASDEFNVAARGTFVPFMQDKTHLASIGAGVWYRNALDKSTRIRQRPGIFRSGNSSFQDANFGIGGVDSLGFNAEGLIVYGPFNLQAEYSRLDVDTSAGDADLDGYYAEAGWFLTGESMNYDAGKGQFGSVKPKGIVGKGGIGAWQIAARYDVLDLNDAVDVLGVGAGGEQRSFSAGLNWYVNNNMRFMLDYINVLEMDRPGNGFDNDEPHGMTFRGEVFW